MESFYDRILTCADSAKFESKLFEGDSSKEFEAIQKAGKGIANVIFKEYDILLGKSPKVLILSGKGHNGADAIKAGLEILKERKDAEIFLYLTSEFSQLKANTKILADELLHTKGSVRFLRSLADAKGKFNLVIEGLVGMNFKLPVRENLQRDIEGANAIQADLKVAVDLPAGLSDESCNSPFVADLTCMTGIAKLPLFKKDNEKFVGRLRYVDLGFFENCDSEFRGKDFLITDKILSPAKKLRKSASYKNKYGHLFIFAGSEKYLGAAVMNARAALRAGVGLVSAFVPESLCASAAAIEPACIWIPCTLDEWGSLALENYSRYRELVGKESAILLGSGFGKSMESQALVCEIIKSTKARVILDADAITPSIISNAPKSRTIITPHIGEFLRISKDTSNETLRDFASKNSLCVMLKDAITRITEGDNIYYNTSGSPILSRGGSGDILSGLCAGFASRLDLNLSLIDCASLACYTLGKTSQKAVAKNLETYYSSSEFFDYLKGIFDE